MQDPQGHALGRPRVGPFPKRSQIRCFHGFPRFRRAHRADVAAGVARRWVGVMEGPTGAPLEVNFQAFLSLKKPNFRPFGSRNGSETAEKRLEKRPSFGQGHG